MAETIVSVVVKTLGGNKLKALNTQLRGTASEAVKAGSATDALGKKTSQLTGKLSKSGQEIRRAANGLEFFIDKAGRARKVTGQFVTTAEAAEAGIKDLGNEAKRSSGKVDALGGAVRKLFAAVATIETAKFIFVKTAELQTQTRSLEVLTGSATNARDIIKELQDFGAVTPFTSSELIETAKRLKAFGIDTENLVDTTKRLGDVAGATGADLSGIATAFGQINAKGKLQTEELLQLQERGVDIATVLKKEYNLTGEEFSKALEKGQISADAANFALKKLTDTGGKYADGAIAQSDTLAGKFSTLIDNVGRFAQAIGQILTPALNAILDQVNVLIGAFNDLFELGGIERGLRNIGALDDSLRNDLFKEATEEAERLLKIGKITKDTFGRVRLNIFQESLKGLAFNEGLIKPTIAKPAAVTLPPLRTGKDDDKTKPQKTAKTARQSFSQLLGPEFQERFDLKVQAALIENQKDINEALKEGNIELADALEKEKDIIPLIVRKEGLENALAQLQGRKNELLSKGATEEQFIAKEKQLQEALQTTINDLEIKRLGIISDTAREEAKVTAEKKKQQTLSNVFKGIEAGQQADAQLTAQAEKLNALYKGIGSTIENGIIGAIDAGIDSLINGTKDLGKSLQDIASGLLKDIGRQLISFGLRGALQSTNLPFFADGGRPEVGKPAIVGEKGPELFIPDTAGTVVPNDEAFNDARNALIDTPARPANEEAEAFAVAAGALARNSQVINNRQTTTQQETSFNNFTEAMMRPGQSTVRFETVNVGDMPMVTREEALRIGAESAKAAEANVFSALRNKPSVRRSIGMK